jgi:hypothetical protein
MRKKIGIFLGLAGIWGLALCGMSHAANVSINLGSTTGVDVYGPAASDFAGVAPTGVTAGAATALSPVPNGWPTAASNTVLGSAIWITNPVLPSDTTSTSYSLFEDTFTTPCTATSMTGTLYSSTNNSGTFYLNGAAEGPAGNAQIVGTATFTPVQGVNTLGFDVATDGVTTTNPVGLLYNAVLTYTVPNVIWRPPLGTGRKILKNGSTLPIKFILRTDTGAVLKTRQDVNVTITSPTGEIVGFSAGQGLKFAKGNGQYNAVFHSKNYGLQESVQYSINVVDSCSGTVLGSFLFQLTPPPKHHGGGNHGHSGK